MPASGVHAKSNTVKNKSEMLHHKTTENKVQVATSNNQWDTFVLSLIDETVAREAIATKMQSKGTEFNIFWVMDQMMSTTLPYRHTFNANL